MPIIPRVPRCALWLIIGFASAFAPGQAGAATADAVILFAAGKVEYQSQGAGDWRAAERGQLLMLGDRLRTGPESRAAVRMSDLAVLQLAASTEITLMPPGRTGGKFGLNLDTGSTYIKSSAQPREIFLRTRSASGAIRGTEFVLSADEAGKTTLTLIDGEVELSNAQGEVVLSGGEQGIVEPGQAPTRRAALGTVNIIQWTLYYPAVIDPAELGLSSAETDSLQASLAAYRAGDLLGAQASHPGDRPPASEAGKVYRAALLLAVGGVDQAEALLQTLTAPSPGGNALSKLIAAVKFEVWPGPAPEGSASEWMADSYYLQSRSQLDGALASARNAAERSPEFGFAWTRVAELEFGFGRTKEALAAMERGLALAPRQAEGLALKGFLLSANNRFPAARTAFEQAIATDGSLANAWLGRGLVRMREGDRDGGLGDLQVAAALEPNRAVLRSYLGKAFNQAGDDTRALREFDLASKLDENDPTPWLYSALLHQQNNQLNEALRDLGRSRDLNDNRGVYRSRFLLDQDQAVRRANLARIYQELGMVEYSAREAARAVQDDYGNYSAHLFLANSFDLVRDPSQTNLRYETPWLSEYLVANLLAPAGVGALSPAISQQEYSRLFDQRRLGLVSETSYLSRGAWQQSAAQYGLLNNASYALGMYYRSDPGQRPNQDQEQLTVTALYKQRVTERDSLFLQAIYYDFEGGDLAPAYYETNISQTLRVKENQEPLLVAGWHREWNPGLHTLLLAGRLDDTLTVKDSSQPVVVGTSTGTGFTPLPPAFGVNADLDYRSESEIYTVELQQIWQQSRHNLIVGARYQTGQFDTASAQTMPSNLGFLFPGGVLSQTQVSEDFQRFSAYAYENFRLFDPLLLTAGLSYDRLDFPENFRNPPINSRQESRDRLSPKAGLFWTPTRTTTVRGTYTRSLGGVSFDQSFQLEPTQIGGFTQTYRSLIPEAVAGAAAAPTFETWGAGLDQKFFSGTYLGLEAQLLKSEVDRTLGAYAASFAPPGSAPFDLKEELDYEERTLAVNAHQILGDQWAAGARYRVSKAELTDRFPQVAGGSFNNNATLQQLDLFLLFHHRCGVFARADALWHSQNNHNPSSPLPDEDFWQFNAWLGYRFPKRHAEVRLGLLNINDQDYNLNPLNIHTELPRERTFAASLRFYF